MWPRTAKSRPEACQHRETRPEGRTVPKAMMINLIQINLNHCRTAQNLVEQTVAERNIEVVIECDPYGIVDGIGGWLTNGGTNRAAIKVFGNNATIAKIETDD